MYVNANHFVIVVITAYIQCDSKCRLDLLNQLVRTPLDYSFEMQIVNLSHLSFKIVLIKYK